MEKAVIILAAGQSKRMMSKKSKFLHEVAGKPLIKYITDTCDALKFDKKIIVYSPKAKLSVEGWESAEQSEPLGTAHAVQSARENLKDFEGDVLVLYADGPFIHEETIRNMFTFKEENPDCDVVVLSFVVERVNRYGRLKTSPDDPNKVTKYIEFKSATDEDKKITTCDAGPILCSGKVLFEMIEEIENNNMAKEFVFADILNISLKRGMGVYRVNVDEDEMIGLDSRESLSQAEMIFQRKKRREIMAKGVSLMSPETVYFSWDTEIGQDCVIEPFVYFAPGAVVEPDTRVKAFSRVSRRYTKIYKPKKERIFSDKFLAIMIFLLFLAMFPLWIWVGASDQQRSICTARFEYCVLESKETNSFGIVSCIAQNMSCLWGKNVPIAVELPYMAEEVPEMTIDFDIENKK